MDFDACRDCGSPAARTHLDDQRLCDSCADQRISELTSFPRLPGPPPPIALLDGEGRSRTLAFRVWRAPTGIEVVVEETGVPPGDGYERAVLGAHDADPDVLVARLREVASEELARRQLEPNPHRRGWLLAGDGLEVRLVYDDEGNEVGTPFKVAVDGRLLSWDELGRALEPYEGWRFRLELGDGVDDLRPDADVIALPASPGPDVAAGQGATIDELLTAFLAAERVRLAPRTYRRYEDVARLLRSCLNDYGHQELDDAERARYEAADESDPEAFAHLFGADKLVAGLAEFLGYFMVRKVMAGEELLRAAGTVTRRLATWLEAHGHIDPTAAAVAVELGAAACRDLPRAERLGSILFDQAERDYLDLDTVDGGDVVEDYLAIERVERGSLWFEGGIGPVDVTRAASDLAQPGWSASLTLARVKGKWRIVEIGNVYP